ASVFLSLLSLGATAAQSQSSGIWDVVGNSGVTCIHTMLLPNSKLMCIERPHKGPVRLNSLAGGRGADGVKPPLASSSTFEDGAPLVYANSFCGGHVQMANGSILVIGGDRQEWHDEAGNNFLVSGGAARRVYTPCGPGDATCTMGTWSTFSDMTSHRWYPTVVTLHDGNQIIIGGSVENINMQTPDPAHNNNPTYEYLNAPSVGTWPKTLPVLTWAFPHSLYPLAASMPSGRVFLFVSNESLIIDPAQDFKDPNAMESHDIPDLLPTKHSPWIYPHTATMTVLPMTLKNNYTFKIQICGGSKLTPRPYASNSCVQINPDDGPAAAWTAVDPMPNARLMPDSVILPDGKILYVNGAGWGQAGGDAGLAQYAADPVFGVDLFDPEAPSGSQWTSLANATVARLYHSGALLLPSGHVITSGSEMQNYADFWGPNGTSAPKPNCFPVAHNGTSSPPCTSPFEQRIERFTPPYLLNLTIPRPNITAAPTTLTYNSTFKITVTGSVDRVTLIRYGSTTHSLNTDQRFMELPIVAKNGNDLYLVAPPSGGYMPPGNHMLWALNQGVPSLAATVNIQAGPQTNEPIPAGS
ncbi:hypothetical protein BDK51DRAFT_12639, partial [Blyttiomyces helicus]